MQNILILSAAVGAGHLRAAEAMELAAKARYPSAQVRNVDVLSLTNAAFRKLYGRAYLDIVNKAPHVLGYIYDLMDKKPKAKGDQLLHLVQKANLRDLIDLLEEREWDLVINTHFLPAEIIAARKRKGKASFPQMTVTTDFETHRLWVNEPCEGYFTATEEGARYLRSFGVAVDRVQVTGIPVHPGFSQKAARETLMAKHGIQGQRPVVLQLAGGFGVGPIQRVHEELLKVSTPMELITVCGRNEQCASDLAGVECPQRHRRHLIGFTREMHELMAIADLVVTKPGGLTSSECLAAGAAMIIINPIPGQESRNADYLLEQGAAVKANNLPTLGYKVGLLLEDEARLRRMKAAARKIGRPRAAVEILEHAEKLAR